MTSVATNTESRSPFADEGAIGQSPHTARVYEDLSFCNTPPHPFRPRKVKHNLVGHPLLTIDSILALSTRLKEDQVQWNLGDLPEHIDRRLVEHNGLTPQQTIERIADCKSWIVLKNVQSDPAYKELLDTCLDEVEHAERETCPGMHQRECYIFVTSPGSVTPLHMDPEHNILHQIQGAKTLRLWDPAKQENLSDEQLEFFYTTKNYRDFQMPKLDDAYEAFTIQAGEGLFFPLEAPHWVQNSDAVSISLSTTWRSTFSHRKVSIHQFNAKLRKRGMNPTRYGVSKTRDAMKFATMRALRAGKRLITRSRD